MVVLGYGFWKRRFAGDPGVVGRVIGVDGVPHTIVGVLPADFHLVLPGAPRDPQLVAPIAHRFMQGRNWAIVTALGRLKPGLTAAAATADMTSVVHRIGEAMPLYRERGANVVGEGRARLGRDAVRGTIRPRQPPRSDAVGWQVPRGCRRPFRGAAKAGRMRIVLPHCEVRSWERGDAESIARHANNRQVWINLRDAFPHPYTLADAKAFIRLSQRLRPETRFAIVVDGQATGGIGFAPNTDVERVSAEIGYWLGEACWGRGITTEALTAVTAYAIRMHGLTRLYALPFEWNTASCRVLEKAGYVLEARLRRAAIKDNRIVDQFLYAYIVAG